MPHRQVDKLLSQVPGSQSMCNGFGLRILLHHALSLRTIFAGAFWPFSSQTRWDKPPFCPKKSVRHVNSQRGEGELRRCGVFLEGAGTKCFSHS